MAVGIEHERAVVIGMIVRTDARRAVVASARCDRGLVEGVDRGAVIRHDCDMHRPVQSAFAADPKIRLAVGAESGGVLVRVFLLRHLHDEAVAQRCQRLQNKRQDVGLGQCGGSAD